MITSRLYLMSCSSKKTVVVPSFAITVVDSGACKVKDLLAPVVKLQWTDSSPQA
jgi:hypothetical protein